ncbi:Peptidase family M28 [Thalassoglobus neptunius]|uniref:Peptidase family M28 n=1 Tax=Thalassoglobus neptunius TaxID=1938619 RepID=A0A5C5X2D2_9PLAN|nr:M28 family peptidase [Thalassoglobus neptunius]TWT57086.1 Peptidase family M28 [Thalassoglobus neptunius]
MLKPFRPSCLSRRTNTPISKRERQFSLKNRACLVPMLATLIWFASSVTTQAEDLIINGQRAFGYLKQICDLGPRYSGSEGMEKQQELLQEHFSKLGGLVGFQDFDATHPQSGEPVRMRNLIVSWHPERRDRIIVCCHYDTRPFPDREPLEINRTKPFIGANDGGSGVALLMELGNHMAVLPNRLGIDFVFFDGEELVYKEGDKYFLGSEHFAQQYHDKPPRNHRYVKGVLVDMIAQRELNVYYERNSLRYAPKVTRSIWATAKRVGATQFHARAKHEIRDDHLPLNQIAKIPTSVIIDFDYPYWHTRNDLPAACSPKSLYTVGLVVLAWLAEN